MATSGMRLAIGKGVEPRPALRHAALAMPFLALAYVTTLGAQSTPRVIDVTASRYEFVPSTIAVDLGERVVLRVRSADRMHGIGIRQFKVNREIPRGAVVDVEFVATEAGTFPIICTEDCGRGHDDMTATLQVKAVAR